MSFDVIGAVEACYAPAPDDRRWLAGVLETFGSLGEGSPRALPALHRTRSGVAGASMAWVFRFGQGASGVEAKVAASTAPRRSLQHFLDMDFDRMVASMPPELVRQHLAPSPPVAYCLRRAARLGAPILDIWRSYLRRLGVEDILGIFASEPDGRMVLVNHAIPVGHPLLSARTLHQLTLFSAHLNSSARLRRALSDASSSTVRSASTEAVLEPTGRVVDASGGARPKLARQTLADAVRRMDRARGALRRTNPEEALGLWQGLVDGTWSLVDQCDSDGKRYVLARRNEPGVRDPKALTQRERSVAAFAAMGHQDKFIGYLLGISAGTVSEHLKSARRKLGLASRAELIRCLAPLIEVVVG